MEKQKVKLASLRRHWSSVILLHLWVYGATPHTSTGVSHCQLMRGIDINTLLPIYNGILVAAGSPEPWSSYQKGWANLKLHTVSTSTRDMECDPPQIVEPCRVTSAVPSSANTQPSATQPEVFSWKADVFIHRLPNHAYYRWIATNFWGKWKRTTSTGTFHSTSGLKTSPGKIYHKNSTAARMAT